MKKKYNIEFISIIIIVQVIISLFIRDYYYNEETFLNEQITFGLSLLFIIISMLMSYNMNRIKNSNFNGFILGIIELIPFILILTFIHLELFNINKLAISLSYLFLHLGGFRDIIYNLFGFKALYNPLYSSNLTLSIHLLGFLLGDIIYLIRSKIIYEKKFI